MTCRQLTDFITDYRSGALPADERAQFEAHIAECKDCVAYLASYEDTIRLARRALTHPDDPVPPDVPETLVRAILDARRRGGR